MKLHIYKDVHGEWRWTIRASNGKIVADSAESYKRKRSCLAMAIKLSGHPLTIVDDD